MKKVVFLVPSLMMGGMEKVLVTYANLFHRANYDVTVLNFTSDDAAVVSGFDKGIHYHNFYNPVRNILKAGIKDILCFNFKILPWRKWIRFHSSKYLYKKYVHDSYDIEIAFFGLESMKIISGSTNDKSKKFGWVHSTNEKTFVPDGWSYKQAKDVFSKMENIVCVSEIGKIKLKEMFGIVNHVYTLPNPIDVKRIRHLAEEKVEKPNSFTFINVSRLSDESKGFLRLLSVCKQLQDEGFDFTLWIVGDGPDKERIKNKIAELELDNIILLGKQANPYKYMAMADAYVCSSYYEGFSITMAEAVSLGIPIVTTNVSGANEMLDDGSYGLIVNNDATGIYNGMKSVMNSSTYRALKIASSQRMDYFLNSRTIEMIESL